MLLQAYRKKRALRRLISLLLCLIMASSLLPPSAWGAGEKYAGLTTEQPALLVTGDGIIPSGKYTADNVSGEKSYTLAELKALTAITNTCLYSTINTGGYKRIYRGEGVDISGLLALSGYTSTSGTIKAVSPGSGGATTQINLGETRYYYPKLDTGSTSSSAPVSALLAWKNKYETAPSVPKTMDDIPLTVMVGQKSVTDVNNSLYNRGVDTLLVGSAITTAPIEVLGKSYTRAGLLMMPRAERSYTYSSSGGNKTDKVRGVPLAVLLGDLSDSTVVSFHASDNYPVTASGMTKGELVAKNALLAYETNTAGAWKGIFKGDAKVNGCFTLYLDGDKPAGMIDSIGTSSISGSAYKHVSYGGTPFKIDAITSATLTVEGPGVESSVPISVRELEETADGNIHRGVYTDVRSGTRTERMYEGVKLLSILDGLVNENVKPLDENVEVVFKNRWRQEVGRMSYAEIKSASAPVILAYGTAYADGSSVSPFVFNMGAGSNPALGNEDGPLKLVYRPSGSPANKFISVAYLYIEEGSPPPGFKHIDAKNDNGAYNNAANTEFILTFTGSELGREVNYTVRELEEMAASDASLIHKDEYNLSNTTYWYVNEYEGIKLWDLLLKMGVSADRASKAVGAQDKTPLVSFASWDNYKISAQFSLYQLANPDIFYFYEKSPLDMGTDRPTKAQLATRDYHPTNSSEDPDPRWTVDSNGYPVKKGYPVMLAYGVNSYPYVRNPGMEGYKSGLGNSGGPMRLIYGKTDGLNRSDPNALENYAYFFNNGSQQLQRLQEVYVGSPVRYSTHLENPAPAYQSMLDDKALTVEVVVDGKRQTKTFTLSELESLLYGKDITKAAREDVNFHRQEKGYYYYKESGGAKIEDLFEGVGFEYLLTEIVGLQGTLGTVELYSGSGSSPEAVYDLSKISDRGYNSMRGTSDLGMMIAFSKNGYPLVQGKDSGGYVSTDPVTGKTIKNSDGPLQFVRAQTSAENASGAIAGGASNKTTVANLTKIVVKLEADKYAHTGSADAAAAKQAITFSGSVAKSGGVSLTVGELETKQRYIVTDTYTVGGTSGTYRGLDLYKLLGDNDIGASSLMDEVTAKNASGKSITLSLSQLTADGKKVILAYGSGAAGSEKPLSASSGGPMRLIIDGGTVADCITNVTELIVSASAITSWKHEGPVYGQYADYKLEISGQNLAYNKTYTAAELEAMDNLIVQDTYKVGNDMVVQGIDLYKLLLNIGFANGLTSSDFTAYATDGYSVQLNSGNLSGGINGKPVLVAFGQGTTADNGLPLVPSSTSPGYSGISGNEFGPLRLIVHDNSGWAVKYLSKIVVGAAGGNEAPVDTQSPGDSTHFTAYPSGEDGMPEGSVRAVVPDKLGGLWIGTSGGGAAYISADGVVTKYNTSTSPALKTNAVSGIAIAPDGAVWLTQGGSVNDTPDKHYGFARYKDGAFTFYNNADGTAELPTDCVYGIDVDKDGNVWLATQYTASNDAEGGLTKFNPATKSWQSWKMADGLPTVSAWAVKSDGKGGAWVTSYRNTALSLTWTDASYAHVSATGKVTAHTVSAGNDFMWSRSIAIDLAGGVYIIRMAGAHDPTNDGGWLDYISPDGVVTSYKGDELIPDLKSKAGEGFSPEIRAVFADSSGNLWLATNGLGVYKASVSGGKITIGEHYSSENGSWQTRSFDDVWYINVSPDGAAYFGSNGGAVTTAGPDASMTRAEFLRLLIDSSDGVSPADAGGSDFSDVPAEAWYCGYVRRAVELGIVKGYPGGYFRPDNLITREEAAVMTARFIEAMGLRPDVVQQAVKFTDSGQISPYAIDSVTALQQYGILDAGPDGSFKPKNPVSRAEAAEMIKNYIVAVLQS